MNSLGYTTDASYNVKL